MVARAKTEAKKEFFALLARRKMRLTSQRLAIVEAVFGTDQHFTAEQLLAWSRLRDPSVSRATVYRTLPLLVQNGFVQALNLGKEETVYDPNYVDHPSHSHIICTDCDEIVEFESEQLAEIESQIRKQLGFQVDSMTLQVTARCGEFRRLGFCQKRERCSHRDPS
ncbi:MAG TPA: transcriptional repressor [Candidatus Paceibacterota bacterium]|nr:transcriptional repressor [Verrucomicrobiota bacterium]HRY50212.1 transcriptional repressor [Candidatus Paceibacterota bacterium]HSA01665.1 transcriptional repressor [Candidatus Paceibacterota bacterium]